MSSSKLRSAAARAHVAAALAHSDADVCPLQSGRVVDPVPSYRHGVAARPQQLDNLQLLLGAHVRKERGLAERHAQLGVVEALELGAGQQRA